MAVSWVAGTEFVAEESSTSIVAAAPSGLASGDVLVAAVLARSAITPPSGWTLIDTSGTFSDVNFSQVLSVYAKNSVTGGDSGANFTWSQSSADRIGVVYAAARSVDAIEESDGSAGTGTDFAYSTPVLTATTAGEMVISFVSLIYGDSEAQSPQPPSGMTLFSGTGGNSYRIAGAYRAVNSGQSGGGSWDVHPTWTDPFSLSPFDNPAGGVTVRLTGTATATQGLFELPDILSTTAAAQVVADAKPAALLADTGPLGAPSAFAYFDFTPLVDETAPKRYAVDLIGESYTVRAPISSWQATQQTRQACYLQVVIPACDPYVDDIADALSFSVVRIGQYLDGSAIEYVMASSEFGEARFTKTPGRNTCTLTGYFDAFLEDATPPAVLDRELRGLRQIISSGSGARVRCAIDWTLRPARRARYGAESFVVGFINYYVNADDEFMDVGSAPPEGA